MPKTLLLAQTLLTAVAVFLRIMVNPLANVFQKQLTAKSNHPLAVNFLTYFLLALGCVPFMFGIAWPGIDKDFWLYSIMGGIVGAMGNGFLVKALEKGELSVLGPINAYKSVVSMLIAVFLLQEIPGLWGLIGVALIIYGSYFILDTTEQKFSWALFKRSEIQFRIWAMILTAIEAVFVKKTIAASSVSIAFIGWCCFGAVFSFLLLFFYRVNIAGQIRQARNYYVQYFLLVACVGIMQLTTNYAFDHMPVGYALALFQLSVIASVILGHRIFSEKDIQKKLIGAAIMIAGSILLILLKR